MRRRNPRNFLPATSGIEQNGDALRTSQQDVSLRMKKSKQSFGSIIDLATSSVILNSDHK